MKLPLLLMFACGLGACGGDDDAPPDSPMTARYVTTRTGTRIAIDVWRPPGDAPVATVLRATRYWRGTQYTRPELAAEDRDEQLTRALVDSGFAVVNVDARGTGASFGSWRAPWSADELADYRDVVDWITAQPWSSGAVAAYGVSYDANAAMMLSLLGHPAVKAVAPLFPDFDPYAGIAFPGGMFNEGFVRAWDAVNHALDRNDLCALAQLRGLPCETIRDALVGPREVPGTPLAEALTPHADNVDLGAALSSTRCRDDAFADGGISLDSVSPYRAAAATTGFAVPWLVRAAWLDANTAGGALAAYRTLPNPQLVIIGATSHAGLWNGDPFTTPGVPASPGIAEQFAEVFEFLAAATAGQPMPRQIRYQTLGDGTWHTTTTWPPAGVVEQPLYLRGEGRLSAGEPPDDGGKDRSQLDPTATTGPANRWLTPLDASPPDYGDRRLADEKTLVYTGEPLTEALVVTGDPRIELHVTPSADAGLIVYLEDVAPDGKVTYVTEGELALAHARPGAAPYQEPRPSHSFRRADLAPVVPGRRLSITIPLAPTSVRFAAGHRVRIAIAGADAGTFAAASGPAAITVDRTRGFASRLILPVAR